MSGRHRPRLRPALVVATGLALLAVEIVPLGVVARADSPTWTDIGDLGGGYTQMLGMSSSGEIAGESTLPPASPPGSGQSRAITWSSGIGLKALPLLNSTDAFASGYAANDAGAVCGTSGIHAAIWYADGRTADLGDLGYHGFTSYCYGINDEGHAVGQTWSASTRAPMFIWAPASGMRDLGAEGEAYAISDADEVTGQLASGHAFAWTATGGIQDLGSLGHNSWGLALNAVGTIVGGAATDCQPNGTFCHVHAALWQPGAPLRDLGTFGGVDSEATAILDDGTVYGWSTTPDGAKHAFAYTDSGGMVEIDPQLPSGWTMEGGMFGLKVDARGHMAVLALESASGRQHTFVGDLLSTTTTSVSCQPGWVASGQVTRCTAVVAGGGAQPTGEVRFQADGSSDDFATCTLAAGSCRMDYRPQGLGVHVVTAAYGGDASHLASEGSTRIRTGPWVDITPQGAANVTISAINDRGEVVGNATFSYGQRAFIWSPIRGTRVLPPLPPGNVSQAAAINDRGDVCGQTGTAPGLDPVIWFADGQVVDLGNLGGRDFASSCAGINDLDHAVGVTATAALAGKVFIWTPGTGMRDSGLPGNVLPTAINDRDEVTGVADRTAFVWSTAGGLRSLGAIEPVPNGTPGSTGAAINTMGWVAGRSTFSCDPPVRFSPQNCHDHAFIWPGSGPIVDLGAAGGQDSQAWTILDNGVVVGYVTDKEGQPGLTEPVYHPFVYTTTTGLVELHPQLPPEWNLAPGYGPPMGSCSGLLVFAVSDGATVHAIVAQFSPRTPNAARCRFAS